MNFILADIDQEGPAWHAFRAAGLGGTEAGVILGLNPYETFISVYEAKTNPEYSKVFSDSGVAAMQHGKKLEDTARHTFSDIIGKKFTPTCAIHKEYSFIRSSLDGISDDYTTLLEIKCPYRYKNFEKHCEAILPYYYAQAQHQLLTTGADLLYFCSYYSDNNSNIEIVMYKVYPDLPLQKELVTRCISIWKSITTKNKPSSLAYYNYELTNTRSELFLRTKIL